MDVIVQLRSGKSLHYHSVACSSLFVSLDRSSSFFSDKIYVQGMMMTLLLLLLLS